MKLNMKKRSLSLLLALLMVLTGIGPVRAVEEATAEPEIRQMSEEPAEVEVTPVKAQEENKDSFNLKSLKFYFVDGEEASMDTQFFQDTYFYDLNLPRETRKLRVEAVPLSPGAEVSIGLPGYSYTLNEENSYSTEVELKPPKGFTGDFIQGINNGLEMWITVKPKNPPENTTSNTFYKVDIKVAGYPRPVIEGAKDLYIFKYGQKVTRSDLLNGVTATDELDGPLSEKIKIKAGRTHIQLNEDGSFTANFITGELTGKQTLIFEVENKVGLKTKKEVEVRIVEDLPDDYDGEAPRFHGVQKNPVVYIGDILTRKDFLKGISVTDNVDKDLGVDDIEVIVNGELFDDEDQYEVSETPRVIYVKYQVQDKAGNKTEASSVFIIEERPLDRPDKGKIPEITKSIAESYWGISSDWTDIGLAIYGQKRLINKSNLLTRAQAELEKNPSKATEYERITVALTAAGLDARKVPMKDGTVNLIDIISEHETMGTLNDYIWALIAYDSGNYPVNSDAKWSRENLINYLLEHQLSDGSWNLDNVHSGLVDVDTTAMAMIALAPYGDQAKVSKALDKAVNVLSQIKTKNYTYVYGSEGETSESSSQVILALVAMGIDPDQDPRFSNANVSIIDGLLSFMTKDYRFKHVNKYTDKGGIPIADPMATEQAFQALSAYLKAQGQNFKPFHAYQLENFSDSKPDKPADPNKPDKPTDPDKPVDPEEPDKPVDPEEPDKPIDPETIVTLYDLKIKRLPNKRVYLEGETPSLKGLEVEAIYSDGSRKDIPISELDVKGLTTDTWAPNRKVTISYGGRTNSFTIEVKAKDKVDETAQIYVADPKGKTYFPAKDLPIKVGTDTAFSLLEKTGLQYKYNYHPSYEGAYVSSIEGLAEFDKGPNSGWMYRVNGVFPNYSASLYKLKAGDRVEWLYTRDLGKDLGHSFEEESDEYNITITAGEGGKVSPSGRVTKKAGEDLTIRITPDKGYEIDSVKVNGKNQGAVSSYTLKDIQSNGKIEVSFVKVKEEETETPEKPEQPKESATFADTHGHWAEKAISHAVAKGYFKGKGPDSFAPNEPITRGQFVTVLGRRANKADYNQTKFKDVDQVAYYTPYINWAEESGLVQGYEDGSFRPDRAITREEMAKIFSLYLDLQHEGKIQCNAAEFIDEDQIQDWAKSYVDRLTAMKLIDGMEDRSFSPKGNYTRAQAAQMLYRLDIQ